MKQTYNVKLTDKSVNALIKKLKTYEKSLLAKTQQVLRKLADMGIQVAYQNEGLYEGHLSFTKSAVDNNGNVFSLVLIGKRKHYVKVSWKVKDGIKTVNVDPLLMAEFGSGWLANNMWDIGGVGQGTFPNQKHASDPKGWWWEDLSGVTHHSIGQQPSYPMYKAWLQMQEDINTVIKEVFK